MATQVRFLLGPAGSGKTFRCLAEIGAELKRSPHGPLLVMLAPKQATFQLERQLLADPGLSGYTRLQILSFERLAAFVVEQLHQAMPPLLAEEGRVMALRALLDEHQKNLRLFHASARLPGFAHQLSQSLREFQRHGQSEARLKALAVRLGDETLLGRKLHDLACLWRAYREWLQAQSILDADCLLDLATDALLAVGRESAGPLGRPASLPAGMPSAGKDAGAPSMPGAGKDAGAPSAEFSSSASTSAYPPPFHLGGLWLDGFAEMTPQQLALLIALLPCCEKATLAFCLADVPQAEPGWLSAWSLTARTFRKCHQRCSALPGCEATVQVLKPGNGCSRFSHNPVLGFLQAAWVRPPLGREEARSAFWSFLLRSSRAENTGLPGRSVEMNAASAAAALRQSLRVAICANPGMEAALAAREILSYVRQGGRFRDCAVLLRQFEGYHDILRRVFTRYEIPFFLDRRESVSHHPLPELTRYALRLVAFGWQQEDWFGALKTGLVRADEVAIDRLENEALAHGWRGAAWRQPLRVDREVPWGDALERLRQKLVPPFLQFEQDLLPPKPPATTRQVSSLFQPSGKQLAQALRAFWKAIQVGGTLQRWSEQNLPTTASSASVVPPSIHLAVWQQMHDWLDTLALGFADRRLPLRDWIPILEAGLAGLSVGVIPPALDQVLIGTIDRSRNPDLQLALVLGLNDTVFPARPASLGLLTQTDRQQLEAAGLELGPDQRARLGQERYYGYIAVTRARRRVVLTCSVRDQTEHLLNPSPFLLHLQSLLPDLAVEHIDGLPAWPDAEHSSELVAPLFQAASSGSLTSGLRELSALPALAAVAKQAALTHGSQRTDALSPALAGRLYGSILTSSVSHLEEFAACPFKYFVSAGLRAKERDQFELDVREQGSFQHLVLARFHQHLVQAGKRWRDLAPEEARHLVGELAAKVASDFREGVVHADVANQFSARALTGRLKDFIEAMIRWMPQYQFDPTMVELDMGGQDSATLPAWELDLGAGQRLVLRGRIDRVDLCVDPATNAAWAVVIDYKSSSRQLDSLLLQHGVQLQLPAYLSALRSLANSQPLLLGRQLIPAGVFYVNLHGRYDSAASREEALENPAEVRQKAYQHTGRFDAAVLHLLDRRPEANNGDQFKYRLKADGTPHQNCRDMLASEDFTHLLDQTEHHLRRLGREILAGVARVDPFQKGTLRPCAQCSYHAICRIDPWTHPYRVLKEIDSGSSHD